MVDRAPTLDEAAAWLDEARGTVEWWQPFYARWAPVGWGWLAQAAGPRDEPRRGLRLVAAVGPPPERLSLGRVEYPSWPGAVETEEIHWAEAWRDAREVVWPGVEDGPHPRIDNLTSIGFFPDSDVNGIVLRSVTPVGGSRSFTSALLHPLDGTVTCLKRADDGATADDPRLPAAPREREVRKYRKGDTVLIQVEHPETGEIVECVIGVEANDKNGALDWVLGLSSLSITVHQERAEWHTVEPVRVEGRT